MTEQTLAPLHVLGISGSLRAGSYNSGLLRAAAEMLPDSMTLEIFDLNSIPLYNADVESAGVPDAVQTFRARMHAANALLIACPEYNYSFSGVLKNALDWASRPPRPTPLDNKPVALMGAGGRFGTLRAQLQLRQVLLHNNMAVLGKPELYVMRAWELFDDNGRLVDEQTRTALRGLLEALADWSRRMA